MQNIEIKVINRIYGKGRGWSFYRGDFADLAAISTVDKALSRLAEKGHIRRVMRGLYDFPKHSKLLEKQLSPDIDQVANAQARKFGWTIQVSGNAALNILGLSSQVPTHYLYHSTGPSRDYKIGNVALSFKKASLKDMGFRHSHSALLVQALKALDNRNLEEPQKQMIRAHFSPFQQKQILKDARHTTAWVYELIKTIFKDTNNENCRSADTSRTL